jgi:flagellar hook protein FlgE
MALIGSLTSGVAAMKTYTKGLEVIGDNIANVGTTGFKGSRARTKDAFSDVLQRSAPSGDTPNTSAMQVGSGVNLASIRQKFTQGSLTATGSPTDIGISGNGFMVVRQGTLAAGVPSVTGGATYVTRAGDFRLDDYGNMVTSEGLFLLDATGAAVTVPLTNATGAAGNKLESFSIDSRGSVTGFYSDGSSTPTASKQTIALVNFADPTALMRAGGNRWSNMQAAGAFNDEFAAADPALSLVNNTPGASGLGELRQGTLEQSNVDLTEEFAELILTQRSFQAGSRIITVSDSVLEDVVNLKR